MPKTLFVRSLLAFILSVGFGLPVLAATQYGASSLLQIGDVQSKHILNGTILDADVSGTAQISATKVAGGGNAGLVVLSGGTQLATSTSLKFATSTSDLYVLSGRIHATSTNFNGVNLTWPSSAGTTGYILATDGTGTMTWSAPASASIGANLVAGEAITTNDALVMGSSTGAVIPQFEDIDTDTGQAFGNNTTIKLAQSIQCASDCTISGVGLNIKKILAPTDNFIIGLFDDSAGAPGTELASSTIAGTSITTSYAYYAAQLTSSQTLTAATQYWLVMYRSGAQDASNYYATNGGAANSYSGGVAKYFAFSVWNTTGSPADYYFLAGMYALAGKVYKATGTVNSGSDAFVGFATASAAAAGDNVNVAMAGLLTGFTGLTAGATYYMSTTTGAISTTLPTHIVEVGIAASTTAMIIKQHI